MHDFSGKVALVTGAASGIGAAIACELGAAGAHVVVVDLGHAAVETVASEIRTGGGTAHAFAADVVAWQLIVRMRRFDLCLAFNCENKGGRILKLTAFEKRPSTFELGL
ncbi:MAG: SDR family NAD(P)-dependent oxidoreductase [Rhizobiaceae bacterium]|nr:SDR family NAD(P)-dependent oxidoreductase [Rhizobiaceae bacterium]